MTNRIPKADNERKKAPDNVPAQFDSQVRSVVRFLARRAAENDYAKHLKAIAKAHNTKTDGSVK